jgi:tetratricopeptide (TPR) repeat protein
MVRHLLANGTIAREGDEWRCASLDDAPLPETVTNAVHAQLTGLDDDLRKTLEIAAVIGGHFRFDTLLEAGRIDEEALEERLEQALHRQLLADDEVAPPDDYRFYHRTIRLVLYAGLSTRRRRKLHERVVEALERVYGDRLDRIAGALCYHHHAVGRWSDALRWGVRAGEDALARCDLGAAETHLARAHDAAERMRSDGDAPPLELRARLDLLRGTLAARLGRAEEARALLKRVAEEAARAGAPALRADALYEVANCDLARGDLESAVAVAGDAARVADEAGDRLRSLQSRVLAGGVLRRLGRTGEAERAFDAILADLDESDPPSLRSFTFQNLAWLRAQVGAFREAGDMAGVALELARAARDPLAEQQAFSTLAFVRVEMGDAAGALALHEASLELARSFALRRREGIDLANVGEAHYLLEHWEEALGHFEEALAIFAEIGDRACEGDCRVNLGRALLASGRVDEALESLEAGIAICRATGRREYEAIGHYYVGKARLERGEPVAARIAYARAKGIFLDLGWHDAWRIDLALAKCMIAEGDREGALSSVREGIERLERARAQLPPTADFARYATEIEELERLRDELGRAGAAPE